MTPRLSKSNRSPASGGASARRRAMRDLGVTTLILALAAFICYSLSQVFDDNNPFASSVYILAVAVISLCTSGYVYGIVASVIGVFSVNFMFTYPFWHFSLDFYGYPLTFFVMLVVSILISALTTRLKKQEALRHEAERAKLRANLLRSISHDIRTPLSAIIGSSSALITNTSLSEADRRSLAEEINRGANWLVRLTENILSVTKLSGDVQLVKHEEVMEEIVGSAIGRFRKLHGELPVRVVRPEEILFVPMNSGLIEQVLFNLLQNVSLHAAKATQITIDIREDGGYAVCSIVDDGGGLPPESLSGVFDGYFALGDGHCVDGGQSMGIGLSVCKSIITAHGGTIRAENNALGGATFTFTLPLKEV